MTNKQYKIAAAFLAAFLAAVMVSMMWLGKGFSFSAFLNAGNVYDFPKEALRASTKSFKYEEEAGHFILTGKRALKKITIDKKDKSWGYLYLKIDEMSVPQMEVFLRYYNKDAGFIGEQPVTLVAGENEIPMDPELLAYRIGFLIMGQKGESISFASMQVRQKERPRIGTDTWCVFAISFAVVFFVGMAVPGRRKQKMPSAQGEISFYLYESLCRAMGRLFGGRRAACGRKKYQRIIFVLLFCVSIAGNLTGWSTDELYFRYHYLLCAALLLFAGFLCWEGPIKTIPFRTPISRAWLLLWGWTAVSDFFTGADVHFHEYVMMGAAGFFIFMWLQTEDAGRLFYIMLEALKIVFFLGIIICLFFCPKNPVQPYTGIFGNAKMSVIFALLLLVTFFVGLDKTAKDAASGRNLLLWDIPGIALSLSLVLWAKERIGYLLAAVLTFLFFIRFLANAKQYFILIKKRLPAVVISLAAAVLAVGVLHYGTKYIPQAVGTALDYVWEEETEIESEKIDKSYLRSLNLYGNADEVKVSRRNVLAENGYLLMAYRYGIFVLLPFCLYQLAVLFTGAAGFWKDGKKLWILGIMLIYIGFGFLGGAEFPLAHPLWICVYLGPGLWFAEEKCYKN